MTAMQRPAALAHGAILSPFTRTRAPARARRARPRQADRADHRRSARRPCRASCPTSWSEAKALLGSYPKIRGSDDLRNAIAAWIGRRYGLAGEIDADARGPARQRLARRPVLRGPAGRRAQALRRAGRPCCIVNPFYQAYLGARLRHQLRAGLPQRHGRDRPPARSRCAGARAGSAARARRPSICARRPTRRAPSPSAAYIRKALALAREYDFMLFFDECYSEIYTREAPTGGSAGRGSRRPSASRTSSSSTRSPSARTCRACARASRPATATSWKRWPRSAT